MFYAVACDKDNQEKKILKQEFSNSIALHSDEKLDFSGFSSYPEMMDRISEIDNLDAALVEIVSRNGVEAARNIRTERENAGIMIIADTTISPMHYMIPSINASSLLLRPCSKEMISKTVNEFCTYLLRGREVRTEDCFLLENQDGKTIIPYNQIYYFEVRGKRIFIRTLTREYCKYETLEKLSRSLPDCFVRCHRSYLVNIELITRVKLSEGTIYMQNDISVPLSRSCKNNMKEYMAHYA